MDDSLNNISIDEMGNIDFSGVDFSAYENIDFATTSSMFDPGMTSMLGTIGVVINILSILFYISGAYGLYLINKKLGEKYSWLSFVPIVQIYNYFTASQKSFVKYLLIPFIIMILGIFLGGVISGVVTPILGVLVMIASYVYFFVMWIKVLHAISVRTGNGAWTTVGFIFVSFIMFPIVGMKMTDKSGENKKDEQLTENKKEDNNSIEL